MPRFIVHVRPSAVDERARAALASRYPEIELVAVTVQIDGTEEWICDAPNATHVERWVTEQHIDVEPGEPGPGSTSLDTGSR